MKYNVLCVKKMQQGWEEGVVKITRGGLGLDNIFLGFCQFHVKKLDKLVKICELLKHNIVFLSNI